MKSNNLVLTLKTSIPYQIKDVHTMSFRKCMIDNKSIIIFFAIQANQGGVIGIILNAQWYEPHSNSQEDIDAIERMQMFQVQWYVLVYWCICNYVILLKTFGSSFVSIFKNQRNSSSSFLKKIRMTKPPIVYVLCTIIAKCIDFNTY